jgi:site-specific recombinase XerD
MPGPVVTGDQRGQRSRIVCLGRGARQTEEDYAARRWESLTKRQGAKVFVEGDDDPLLRLSGVEDRGASSAPRIVSLTATTS